MAQQQPVLEIRCPHKACGGEIRIRWDGIATCLTCQAELGVWGKPLDVPPGESTVHRWRRPMLVGATAVLLFLLAQFAGLGIRDRSPGRTVTAKAPTLATFTDVLEREQPPAEFPLPTSYRDPESHIEAIRTGRHTAMQSPLFLAWQQFPADERIEALDFVIRHENVGWLSSLLIDIVYFGMSSEYDPYVADMMRSATLLSSHLMPDVCVLLMEFIGRVSAIPEVREEARSNAKDLRSRVQQYGR